jgi:DNA polymerase-3 subunit beta
MPVEAVATPTGTTTMEITVSKFELLRELTATQGVVERKTTIPILSNYLFEAGADKLSLTATDLDLSLRTSCNAKVKKEGSCTIPARKLHDYVKLLPDADITIKLLENHWVSIRCGRSNTKMVGMARSNFPSLPAFPTAGVVKIPAGVLREMIAKTTFAIANEESRYTLNGALMVLKPESITMVATDGHRLAHIERGGEKFEGVSGQFADERSRAVRMKIEKGELKISASSTETGESEDSIETNYNGDSVTIGFNAAYLIDFLKATGSGEVRMEFKDAQSAGQLRPAEGDDYKYRYIVMPMRI